MGFWSVCEPWYQGYTTFSMSSLTLTIMWAAMSFSMCRATNMAGTTFGVGTFLLCTCCDIIISSIYSGWSCRKRLARGVMAWGCLLWEPGPRKGFTTPAQTSLDLPCLAGNQVGCCIVLYDYIVAHTTLGFVNNLACSDRRSQPCSLLRRANSAYIQSVTLSETAFTSSATGTTVSLSVSQLSKDSRSWTLPPALMASCESRFAAKRQAAQGMLGKQCTSCCTSECSWQREQDHFVLCPSAVWKRSSSCGGMNRYPASQAAFSSSTKSPHQACPVRRSHPSKHHCEVCYAKPTSCLQSRLGGALRQGLCQGPQGC